MRLLNYLMLFIPFAISNPARTAIYLSASSRVDSGVCQATVKSIGTCFTPSDIFYFKVVTDNKTVEFNSKSSQPQGFDLKNSTNAQGEIDGQILTYKFAGKSSVSVSKVSSDGAKSDVGMKKLSCNL